MHRIFFEIGGLQIAWFGVMMVAAFFAGLVNWNYLGRKEGRDLNFCSDLLLWIMIGGIVGARVAYVASDLDYFMEQPVRIIMLTQGGLIFYGGFIGAGVAIVAFALRRRQNVIALFDFVITSVPLGHVFGRIGCFMNGCCYGGRWDGSLAVTYPSDSFAADAHRAAGLITQDARSLPVHPVQLYESAANLLLFFLLVWAFKRRRRDGRVLALYLTTYPVIRFLMEFLRGDERLRWQSFDVAQDISIALFVAGCALWLWTLRANGAPPAQPQPAKT